MRQSNSKYEANELSKAIDRRGAIKTIGAAGVGLLGADTVSGRASARYWRPRGGNDGNENWTSYDAAREVVNLFDDPFANVQSNVVGPQFVQADFETVNLATSMAISSNPSGNNNGVNDLYNIKTRNPFITVREVSSPGSYDFSSISVYKQHNRPPASKVMKYALDTLWEVGTTATGVKFAPPSPMGLILGKKKPKPKTGRKGRYIHVSPPGNMVHGMRWNLDLHAGPEGVAVPGDYKFEVTYGVEIGTGGGVLTSNPYFDTIKKVEQKHDVSVTVKRDE